MKKISRSDAVRYGLHHIWGLTGGPICSICPECLGHKVTPITFTPLYAQWTGERAYQVCPLCAGRGSLFAWESMWWTTRQR